MLNQWKFPRYQSTSVIHTSPDTWRKVATVFRIAEPHRRAAKHLGHTWYIGKRFCISTSIFISSLSSRIASMEFVRRAAPFVHSGEKVKGQNKIMISDASQDRQPKIQSSSVEETL